MDHDDIWRVLNAFSSRQNVEVVITDVDTKKKTSYRIPAWEADPLHTPQQDEKAWETWTRQRTEKIGTIIKDLQATGSSVIIDIQIKPDEGNTIVMEVGCSGVARHEDYIGRS